MSEIAMTHDLLREVLSYDRETGEFRWKISPGGRAIQGGVAGTFDHEGYRIIRYRGKGYKAHRLAWLYEHGKLPTGVIDHINGVKDDNRLQNLRDTTASVNAQNVSRANKSARSGYRWVSWFEQYRQWKGSYQLNGRKVFVGHFDDRETAYAAVLASRLSNGAVQPGQKETHEHA
jgi:hypothetical protein